MARGWKDQNRPAHEGFCRNVKEFGLYLLNGGKTWKVEKDHDATCIFECWLWLQCEEQRQSKDTGSLSEAYVAEAGLGEQRDSEKIVSEAESTSLSNKSALVPTWVLRMKAKDSQLTQERLFSPNQEN